MELREERKERTNGRDSPIMRNSNLQILIVLPQRSKVVAEGRKKKKNNITSDHVRVGW